MLRLYLVVLLSGCGRYLFDPLVDAGATGDDAPEADAPGTCAGHTFCDDFDRASPVVTGWDELVGTGGTMSLVTDQSVSPPSSLLIDMPNPAVGNVTLRRSFPLTTTHARISFDLSYTTTAGGIAELDLVRLRWLDLPGVCTNFGYYMVRNSTGPLLVQETYTNCGGNVNTPVVFDTGFHHIDMDVVFGPQGTSRVTVDIDGTNMFTTMPTRTIPSSRILLELGVPSQRDIIAPWEVRYDNVVLDLD